MPDQPVRIVYCKSQPQLLCWRVKCTACFIQNSGAWLLSIESRYAITLLNFIVYYIIKSYCTAVLAISMPTLY